MTITVQCNRCSSVHELNELIWKTLRRTGTGLPYPCPTCNADLYKEGQRIISFGDNNRRLSKKQEGKVATREGGRRQPGSGAVNGFEGDVRTVGKYRGECKFTRSASYSLKLADLKKLETQAAAGELPVFDLEFRGESPPKRYVILPEWVYETLMEESGRRDNGLDTNDK